MSLGDVVHAGLDLDRLKGGMHVSHDVIEKAPGELNLGTKTRFFKHV